MSLSKAQLLDFPKLSDERGDLSFIEYPRHIPFEVKRIFYLYNISDNQSRGAHAHKKLEQILIPISGEFDVTLDEGETKKTFHLAEPWKGLYIPPMIWNVLTHFSPGTICLALASDYYKEEDYHRNYLEFITDVKRSN